MDNRRMSARAEAGTTRPSSAASASRQPYGAPVATTPFLERALELTRVNWEIIVFVGIMALVILTRVWDLGSRAMHHDESIHAYFSNYYLQHGDYTTTPGFGGGYDPTYHGPFLYTIVAFGFFLFGTNDALARFMPAVFGIILVGLCWLLRPFIGRMAAILAAALILISPSISYYSRSLRHDIFALTGTFLLFIAILWFLRTHKAKWVYLGALGLIVAYASHELTFIIMAIFASFLLIAAFAYNAFSGGARTSNRRFVLQEAVNPVMSAVQSLRSQPWTIVGGALIFFGIYVALFTNMLTHPLLARSGIIEGFKYWFLQQHEARGQQPIFYYLLLMPIYEPLALLAGLGTVVYLIVKWIKGKGHEALTNDDVDVTPANADAPVEDQYGHILPSISGLRGLTLGFLAYWSFGAFIAFSLAGEKMPWLNMQIALPFTILAAAGLGKLLAGMEWREVRKGGGLILGVAFVLFVFAAFALVTNLNGTMPAPTGGDADLQHGLRGVLLFLFVVGLLALSGWLAYKMTPGRAVKVIGFTIVLFLVAYGIRSMTLLNYRHGDTPNELMVYTQSSPDTVIVADLIKRLSRDETSFDADRNADDVTGGHGLSIAMDSTDATEWPFDWYFRDMRSVQYHKADDWKTGTPSNIPPNVAVIIASDTTEATDNFKNFIKDKYTSNHYVLNWWFPEDGTYKTNNQGDLGQAIKWLTSNGMKYILYRDPGKPLGSRNFYLHIRNDLAVKTGLGSAGAVSSSEPPAEGSPADPGGKSFGMLDLQPSGSARGQFNLPRGIATAPDGSFYVVDTANMRIQKFDATGKWLAIFGGKGNGDGQFAPFNDTAVGTGPGGIAVDKQGNVYVADTWNHRIQKFDSTGKFLAKWGEFINFSDAGSVNDADRNSKFFGPRGVAVGPDGNVYVTDTGNKRVAIFDSNGKFLREISSGVTPDKTAQNYPYSAQGELNEPIGVAVDSAGNVYVADSLNKRIQKFDAQGKFAAAWPVPAGDWDAGSYLEPFLALDSQGNVYATAPTGKKVMKFNPAGQLLGEKSASPSNVSLKTPTGVTIGADGKIYVVDTSVNGVINMGTIP